VQHRAVEVAGQHDIAAAAEDQARQAGQRRRGQRRGQLGHRADPRIAARARVDPEGVAGFEGKIVGNGEVGRHGGRQF
jgi:hypothetical protein